MGAMPSAHRSSSAPSAVCGADRRSWGGELPGRLVVGGQRVRDDALWVLVGAWERQLNMKRKTDVLHKVNDDVITNVGGDVLQGL